MADSEWKSNSSLSYCKSSVSDNGLCVYVLWTDRSTVDAQKETLPPRVASPTLLLDALRYSSPSFSPDTTLPLPLDKDYIHAAYQLCDIHVYIYRERLGYVISVPLVQRRTFSVLRIIPIPVHVNQECFLCIDVGESVLCLDRARQYYFTMKENVLAQWKLLEPGQNMCKYQRTLLSAAFVESCTVMMLQKREALPSVCDTRLVKLSHTAWSQLANNTRIYFAPRSDTITVLWHDDDPVVVSLKGISKLQVHPCCKGCVIYCWTGWPGKHRHINIEISNDSFHVTDAASPQPKRTLRPRVAKSYF